MIMSTQMSIRQYVLTIQGSISHAVWAWWRRGFFIEEEVYKRAHMFIPDHLSDGGVKYQVHIRIFAIPDILQSRCRPFNRELTRFMKVPKSYPYGKITSGNLFYSARLKMARKTHSFGFPDMCQMMKFSNLWCL